MLMASTKFSATSPNCHPVSEPEVDQEKNLVRETFTLPREQAGATARDWLKTFPASSYWSRIESWQMLSGDRIVFTMVRLPSAEKKTDYSKN